ncbi:VOC family protein [Paenibacillus marinisediminis]
MGFHSHPNLYIRDITLQVSQLEKSIAFYVDLLGFKVLKREESRVVLTADGITPLIILEQPQGVKPKQPRTSGLYHFAILLPTRADLGKFLEHLAEKQIGIGAADHTVSEALYFSDPDDNGIEVYIDRPSETWTWNNNQVLMTTDPLNAHGVLAAGNGEKWTGMPAGTLMGHIHLHVSNLQEAKEFYTEMLGYEVVCEYGSQALFLSSGKYHHHIGLNTWNGEGAPAPDARSAGMKEYSIAIPSESYKQRVIQSLVVKNINFEEVDGVLYTSDPSHNRIALHITQS